MQQQFRPFTPTWLPEPPPCQLQQPVALQHNAEEHLKPFGNSSQINFVLPFLDIDIEIERSTHVLQDHSEGTVFILHGHELFQIFLGHKEKRISLMGYLEGSVKIVPPLAAKVSEIW